MNSRISLLALFLVLLSGLSPTGAQTFDHAAFTSILQRYVDNRGMVDYAALKANRAPLDAYIARLEAAQPRQLSRDEQLAFWINAYNALTLRLVIDHYPVPSILRITRVRIPGMAAFIPGVNSPFARNVTRIGGTRLSLDDIEHGIIRREFTEPRIHFAVVCAAVSCPPLRREAYTGARLDAQLQDQGIRFLTDRALNRIPDGDGQVALSKILDWYKQDFGPSNADLLRALAPFFSGEMRARLERGSDRVRFLDYNWSLNDRSAP